ncbi:unnamed protein product [Protopolystoma xenopodis]|uniref:Uncharacterized protein n=1 Tax=Protopolystoma xenopodis TaxID=117903 RepID=A0A3S5AEK2_9PLAT|nr:unnamed protein product [Protopolystoma xenopodis]
MVWARVPPRGEGVHRLVGPKCTNDKITRVVRPIQAFRLYHVSRRMLFRYHGHGFQLLGYSLVDALLEQVGRLVDVGCRQTVQTEGAQVSCKGEHEEEAEEAPDADQKAGGGFIGWTKGDSLNNQPKRQEQERR